jgi:hypothetical protein
MAVTSLLKPRSIARKALSFYIQKAGSNQGAAFDFITYLADKLYKVLINSDDTEAGYLEDKLTASGFSEVEINTNVDGYKSININSEADIGDLNDVVITDVHDNDILSYDGATLNWINTQNTYNNDKVKISSDDGSADYLEDKIVEGDYITIAKETDIAGKQTLKISSTGGGSDPITKIFSTPSTSWEVNHYRGYRPVINITDLNGNAIDVDYNHLNDGQFVVTPADAITGIVTYY